MSANAIARTLAAMAAGWAVAAHGAVMLADFEGEDAAANLVATCKVAKAELVGEFASSGAKSLRYECRSGGGVAYLTVRIAETDFADYDRLCIDVVNMGPNADELHVQIAADGDALAKSFYNYGKFRRRLWAEVGKSCWTVDLGLWPKGVKSKKASNLSRL